jgi:hypothetical protein
MELSKMMSEYVAQERNKKLIAVAVENSGSLTSVRELYDHIASSDEMKGLKEALSSANDPNDPIELAHLTNKFLASRDSVLFLQLDEFAVEFMTPEFLAAGISSAAKSLSLSATLPTDIRTSVLSAQCSTSQQAMQSSTPSPSSRPSNLQLFYGLWTNVLTPIVKSPQMVLYVCGKSPLFDQLGTGCGGMASPTGVLQLPLDLLDRKYIRKVLDSISVYQENGVEPMPLSEVFRRILKDTPGGRTPLKSVDPLCELIHKVSGGVPRYVQHVIVEMLKMDEIRRVMFDVESFVPLGKLKGKGKSMVHYQHLEQQFSEGGDALTALRTCRTIVKMQAILVEAIKGMGTQQRAGRFFDLLSLLVLDGRPIRGVPKTNLLESKVWASSWAGRLLNAAHFWGVYRSYDTQQQTLTFTVPTASSVMLRECAAELLQGKPSSLSDNVGNYPKALLMDRNEDITGEKRERAVFLSLLADRACARIPELPSLLLGKLGRNYLSLDSAAEAWPVQMLPIVRMTRENSVATDTHIKTSEQMEAYNAQQVADAEACDKVREKICLAEDVMRHLTQYKDSNYLIFRTGFKSEGADQYVRHKNTLVHISISGDRKKCLVKELHSLASVINTAPTDDGVQHVVLFLDEKKVRTSHIDFLNEKVANG